MNEVITNIAAGAAAGGVLQIISEAMKVVHTLADVAINTTKANNAQYRANAEAENKTANDANKRSNPILRATIAIIVFVAAFWLIFINGWVGTETSLITQREPWLNLFGILRFGGGEKVLPASGFVMPIYFGQTVQVIAGFIFGIMAVRTGRK